MGTVRQFEELEVWRESKTFVKAIYLITGEGLFSRDFGLRDQLRRASVSIMSNIAEGFERGTNKEFTQFLHIAKGSAGEARSLLHVASDVGYVNQKTFADLNASVVSISRRLSNFIKYLQRPSRTNPKPDNART